MPTSPTERSDRALARIVFARVATCASSSRRPDRIVAREWRRCDLAILDRAGVSEALVELKATASFDAVFERSLEEYRGHVAADLRKARALGGREVDVYGLLISTHIEGIPDAPRWVVKYADKIKRSAATPGLAERTRLAIDGVLGRLGSVRHVLGLQVSRSGQPCGGVPGRPARVVRQGVHRRGRQRLRPVHLESLMAPTAPGSKVDLGLADRATHRFDRD
jgi:hypothetical protein